MDFDTFNSFKNRNSNQDSDPALRQDTETLIEETNQHEYQPAQEHEESRIKQPRSAFNITNSKKRLLDELKTTATVTKCPDHPQEDLEFYSFTNNKLLCTECLIMGRYAGHDVINIKKANGKVKEILQGIISSIKERENTYNQWSANLELKREELDSLALRYQKYVKKGIEDLAQKLVRKEGDLFEGIAMLQGNKHKEFEAFESDIRKHREELMRIEQIIEENLSPSNEANLCFYYSRKSPVIKEFLKDEESFRITNRGYFEEGIKLAEQFSLDRFNETLKIFKEELEHFPGLEEIKSKLSAYKPIEKFNDYNTIKQIETNAFKKSSPTSHFEQVTPASNTKSFKEDIKGFQFTMTEPDERREAEISSTVRTFDGNNAKKCIKDSFFEQYYDKISSIRKKRNVELPIFIKENQSTVNQTRFETERKKYANKKLSGPSSTIAEAYERLLDSRRDPLQTQPSPVKEPIIHQQAQIPVSYIAKNDMIHPSSFVSPTKGSNDLFEQGPQLSRRALTQTLNTLPSYRSPREETQGPLLKRLQEFRKEKLDLWNL